MSQQEKLALHRQYVANVRQMYPDLPAKEARDLAYNLYREALGDDEQTLAKKLAVKQKKDEDKRKLKEHLQATGYKPTSTARDSSKTKLYHDWAKRMRMEGKDEGKTHQQLVSEASKRYVTNPEEFRSIDEVLATPIVLPKKKSQSKSTKVYEPIEGLQDRAGILLKMRQERKPQVNDSELERKKALLNRLGK